MKLVFVIPLFVLVIYMKSYSQSSYTFFEKSLDIKEKLEQEMPSGAVDFKWIDSLMDFAKKTEMDSMKFEFSFEFGLKLQELGELKSALEIYSLMLREYRGLEMPAYHYLRNKSKLLNALGALYGDLGGYNKALVYYQEAMVCMDSMKWEKGKAMVNNNIGKLYALNENYLNAEKYFKQAIGINREMENKKGLIDNYNNIAGVFRARGDLGEAVEYYLSALELVNEMDEPYLKAGLFYNLGGIYEELGDMEISLSYLKRAKDIEIENDFKYFLAFTNALMSRIYCQKGNLPEALSLLDEMLELAEEIHMLEVYVDAYLLASEIYNELELFDDAYNYLNKSMIYKDSLVMFNANQKLLNLHTVFDLQQEEKKTKLLAQELKLSQLKLQRQQLLIVVFVISVLFFVGITLVLIYKRKADKKSYGIIQKQKDQIFHQKEMLMKEKENELNETIDSKNRQLTSHTLSLINKNELQGKIVASLKELMKDSMKETNRKMVQELIVELRKHSTNNTWDEFKLYFEQVHQDFYRNLSEVCPDLTPNDQKIAAFLKLGLTTKEISSITFREIRSVEASRLRLRKKLGIESDINLTKFLAKY